MKRIVYYIFSLALVLSGLLFAFWAFFMWMKIGFRYESDYALGNKDGQFFSVFILIGLGVFMYGYFNLKFRKCWNKKETNQAPPTKSVRGNSDKSGSR